MSRRHLIHGLLAGAAETRADAAAVVDRNGTLTYAELETRANQVGRQLVELGVAPGDRVGIYCDKSTAAIVGIYGAMKAGAAYVPLDVKSPAARVGYIARDCDLRWLVTATANAARWPDLLAAGAPVAHLLCDEDADEVDVPDGVTLTTAAAISAQPGSAPPARVIDADLAYILYTSGSTGEPKGVMLTHRNGLAFVDWAVAEYGVVAEDRLSSHAPLHFDLSVFDLFAASHAGAAVALVPPALSVFPVEVARFIRAHAITVWYSVPSILVMLATKGSLAVGDLPTLRTILFAGEVFPTRHLAALMDLLPHVAFANLYGPTETNVCTAYRVPAGFDPAAGDLPIGRAITNDETVVLADDGAVAPAGTAGELCVRGATVMRGYWGDPARTAARLVADPRGQRGSDPLYHTGDVVVEVKDGDYRFLGRKDNQVKSRGYRIELGEIETALHAHPAVVEAAAVAVPDEEVSNRITAYVVVSGEVTAGALAAHCATRIPRYMVPESFTFRDELPKTSTGKLDRRALS